MAMFHCYVSSPEGNFIEDTSWLVHGFINVYKTKLMSNGSQWGITMVYGGYAVTLVYHSSWFYKSTNVTQLGSPKAPNPAHGSPWFPLVHQPPGSPTLPTLPVIQGPQTLLITEAACEIVFTTGVYLAGKQRVHRGRFASRLYGSATVCPKKIKKGPTFRPMGGKFRQVFLMFQSPKPCLSEIPISIIFKTAPWCNYNTWWPGAIFRITNGPPKKNISCGYGSKLGTPKLWMVNTRQ